MCPNMTTMVRRPWSYCSLAIFIISKTVSGTLQGNNTNETEAAEFIARNEAARPALYHDVTLAAWTYKTNLTEYNQQVQIAKQVEAAAFNKAAAMNASSYAWKTFADMDLQRKFKLISNPGTAVLPEHKFHELSSIIANMTSIYSKAKICPYDTHRHRNCNATWNLDPEISKVIATSRNYDELLYAWQQWHETSARPMRSSYVRYVELNNEAARLNGFRDTSEDWLDAYESETFSNDVEKLWETVRPFYLQLHAYVRRKLIGVYGSKVRHDGPIPAHLLGNMWSQSWENVESLVKPFREKPSVNATPEMLKENYTALKMFHVANDFYKSVGLIDVPPSFWNWSMITRPEGRDVVCHASAWDFFDRRDVRIKMCTEITTLDLFTIHHELGHIQYYMQYKNQPITYREGANPGFHEAVGDTMALSASTASHLKKIGLLPDYADDKEGNLNSLMSMALQKIAFLPFAYTMDLWRWKVFRGEITPENYNQKWWELKKEYQGIEPAVPRSELDFDPGAKYHIASDVEYLRYFVSFIIQFQFHKALCIEAGQYTQGDPSMPLHKCDIYQNRNAGALFSNMLKMGSSKPWPEALYVVTKGQTKAMDASAIIEYFKPLMEFLEEENKKNHEYIGWRDVLNDTTTTYFESSTPPDTTYFESSTLRETSSTSQSTAQSTPSSSEKLLTTSYLIVLCPMILKIWSF